MTTDPTAELRAEVDRLVASAREGDRAAFDELVRRTYVDTYTLAMRLTANEEDARDVVQESYLRAWKGIKRFRGDAQFSTWMYRITANAAATLVQKRRRRRAESLDTVDEPIDTSIEGHPKRRRNRPSGSRISPRGGSVPPSCGHGGPQGRVRLVARGHRRGPRHLGRGGEGEAAPGAEAPP
jgi:RNA polymerase sigma factor (sigma-70 family)